MTLIQQLCREIISYADEKPFNMRLHGIAALAEQVLREEDSLPIYDMNAVKPEGEG